MSRDIQDWRNAALFDLELTKFRAVSGLSQAEIITKVQSIRICFHDAYLFYVWFDRFPTNEEDAMIFDIGMDNYAFLITNAIR